ncbi:MAG: hypothetical protein V4488_08980 [Pseudomonadota bacterium]
MKNSSRAAITELLREVVQAFAGLLAYGGRALMRMPLPRLMLICLGLAMALTILPLALSLFVVFLGLKLLLLLAMLAVRKARRPRLLGHSGSQPGG